MRWSEFLYRSVRPMLAFAMGAYEVRGLRGEHIALADLICQRVGDLGICNKTSAEADDHSTHRPARLLPIPGNRVSPTLSRTRRSRDQSHALQDEGIVTLSICIQQVAFPKWCARPWCWIPTSGSDCLTRYAVPHSWLASTAKASGHLSSVAPADTTRGGTPWNLDLSHIRCEVLRHRSILAV